MLKETKENETVSKQNNSTFDTSKSITQLSDGKKASKTHKIRVARFICDPDQVHFDQPQEIDGNVQSQEFLSQNPRFDSANTLYSSPPTISHREVTIITPNPPTLCVPNAFDIIGRGDLPSIVVDNQSSAVTLIHKNEKQ